MSPVAGVSCPPCRRIERPTFGSAFLSLPLESVSPSWAYALACRRLLASQFSSNCIGLK